MPPVRRPPQFPSVSWTLERRQDPRSLQAHHQLPHRGCGLGVRFNPSQTHGTKKSFWKTGRGWGLPARSALGQGQSPGREPPSSWPRPPCGHQQAGHPPMPGTPAAGGEEVGLGWIFELVFFVFVNDPKKEQPGTATVRPGAVGGTKASLASVSPSTQNKQSTVVFSLRQTEKPSPPRQGPVPCCRFPPSVPLRRDSDLGLWLSARLGPWLGPGGRLGPGYQLRTPAQPSTAPGRVPAELWAGRRVRAAPPPSPAAVGTSSSISRCFSGTDLRIF